MLSKDITVDELTELAKTNTIPELVVITNITRGKIKYMCKKNGIVPVKGVPGSKGKKKLRKQEVFNQFLKANRSVSC